MSDSERTRLAALLDARKKELRLTQAQIAERAGISTEAVGNLLRGEQDNPEFVVLRAVARALDLPLALMLGAANPVAAAEEALIPYAGQAEVGVFRSEKKQPGGATARIGLPSDARVATNARIAVTVMDDSLMGLSPPVPAGYTALVVALVQGFEVEHGRVYLIHRPNADGAIETSFRRAAVYPDRYEFAPASPDVARNERETIKVLRADLKSSDIEIGGLFFAAYCQYL